MNILIVDDEAPAVQGILRIVDWKKLGIANQFTAYSAREAMEQFLERPVELLLTDIEMRGETGFDLIQWVEARNMGCVTIILSGFPNFRYAQRAISLGVFEYLLKPIEDSQLCMALDRAAAQFRRTRDNPVRSFPPRNAMVEQAKKYVYDHISQNISRQDIANHVNLTPEYLSTFFKRETGHTISDFIKAERIAFAKRLLRQTNLPISAISDNVGFDSLSYFSAVFHSATGRTPREYRKSADAEI
ncbi:MAG: helix-turn-helix domain-containing protein [Oscillospiraceae bacterium]|jgi:two-component system sensor histidine kinase YesM|nr:helix-turn-helix domain-containing protein [Oscillospiraceae bacterium]